MESLQGKNALVTGAGKGLGKAIAIALAAEGVNIALLGRTESDLIKVADELKQYKVKTAFAIADVSDIDAVNSAVAQLKQDIGTIDILINNAGVGAFGKFMELEPAKWKQVIEINLLGVYYVTRAVLPEMIERQLGDIINVSSTAGKNGAAVTSAYSASKFGLIGLSESLMQEVRKHNIRVSTMLPSTVATDMAINLNLTDGNPERVMQPEDFAELLIAQLKLNRRVFIKESGIWSTNP
ncbi:3-ketoacyl-ACP reductase [Pedobacter namyangjuensis]|uniref:3-ketoacyl-ACP reductase n=1 Tax=Pedobacter namyangjuensis TaxID=600626 RepID=UPI000DE1DA1F|nr:3-ketoacyl-ACP reductase [Pedobacter namyangjuensis]